MPGVVEGVEGEGKFGRGEHVEKRGVGGTEGRDGVNNRRTVDLDPDARAGIVSVRGDGVRGPGGLRVNNEPGFDGVDVKERRRNRAFP